MQAIPFEGMTGALGAPKDWNPDKDGECFALPVKQNERGFLSVWVPTAEELAILTAGGAVILSIVGDGHPPVMLSAASLTLPSGDQLQ